MNLVGGDVRALTASSRRRDRALDHGAPFQHRAVDFLREHHGAVIKWAPSRRRQFSHRGIEKLLTARTKMVAITHMSNALGTIVPVKEVVRIRACARHPGLIDGSQARASRHRRTGHRLPISIA